MNNLDKQYQALLQDVLDNGVVKQDRTTTGTISVFGRQIRHKMSEGFPLLTTKKVFWKGVVVELLWFLRGDTNIKFLWENNCSIWDGDWYKKYKTTCSEPYALEEIKRKLKDGTHKFHDSMFDMGPIYGKSWRDWLNLKWEATDKVDPSKSNQPMIKWNIESIDQIANLINDLKTNPDSRRLMVSAWNVGELDKMTLPPCHNLFQMYSVEKEGKRHLSIMVNIRSNDIPLGLPFNIASYGLLLEIISKIVGMVPDELIINIGDAHIYLNQIEGIKEQLTRGSFDLPKLVISNQVNFSEGIDELLNSCLITDFQIEDYHSHPSIKIPLSN